MAHQVVWTKLIIETFVEEAMLTKDEERILRTRAAGWTRTQQAMEFNMSISNVDKIIKRLKVKYDMVEKNNVILPPRKFSTKELYMDTH